MLPSQVLVFINVISDLEHICGDPGEVDKHFCSMFKVDDNLGIVPVLLTQRIVLISVAIIDAARPVREELCHMVGDRGGGDVFDG